MHRAKCLHLDVSQVDSECMSGLNGLMDLLVKTKFGALSGSLASWAETHSQSQTKLPVCLL